MRVKKKLLSNDIELKYCDICKQPVYDYEGAGELTVKFNNKSVFSGKIFVADICDGCFEIFKINVPLEEQT